MIALRTEGVRLALFGTCSCRQELAAVGVQYKVVSENTFGACRRAFVVALFPEVSFFACIAASATRAALLLAIGWTLVLAIQAEKPVVAGLALTTVVDHLSDSGLLLKCHAFLVLAILRWETVSEEVAAVFQGAVRGAVKVATFTPLVEIFAGLVAHLSFQAVDFHRLHIVLVHATSIARGDQEE